MRIAILSGDGWHVRSLLRAAAELGHVQGRGFSTRCGCYSDTSEARQGLDGLDAVIDANDAPGSLEQVVFRMDLLHALEARGVPILNPPRALEVCVDKYLALVRLESTGLQCRRRSSAKMPMRLSRRLKLSVDVVVKPIFGSEGRGMVRVTDPTRLANVPSND